MDINDLKIMIYESLDSGEIDKETCQNMILATESIGNHVANAMISVLESGLESLKEIYIKDTDYKIDKDININKDKETEIYSCTNIINDCVVDRNIVAILTQFVRRLVNEYKGADHHKWKDKVHDKVNKKAIKKLESVMEERNEKYSEVSKNYLDMVDITTVTYSEFPKRYKEICNSDIKFYNNLLSDMITDLSDCRSLLELIDEFELLSFTGIIKTYVSTVLKVTMDTSKKNYAIIKRTLDHNKKTFESL